MTSNIGFVIYSLGSGGAERVLSILANGLGRSYRVHVITLVESTPFYEFDDSIELIPCFPKLKASKNILQSIRQNLQIHKRLAQIVKDQEIELLIGFMTTANIHSILISKKFGFPVLVSERNHPVKKKIPLFWSILRRLSYPYANNLVVQTSNIMEYFQKYIDKEKLLIIPNPIAPNLTDKRHPSNNVNRKKIILNVGRLTKVKNQKMLIEAFAQCDTAQWKLVIVGEGPERKNLTALINKLKLAERVVLVGRSREIDKFYNEASIFGFTSLYEGMPNALIEAMHFGVACISTDCPSGPSDLIVHDENGYLVPVGDLNMFKDCLNSLIQNEAKRKKFGTNAMRSVEHLTFENIIRDWDGLIKTTISQN